MESRIGKKKRNNIVTESFTELVSTEDNLILGSKLAKVDNTLLKTDVHTKPSNTFTSVDMSIVTSGRIAKKDGFRLTPKGPPGWIDELRASITSNKVILR